MCWGAGGEEEKACLGVSGEEGEGKDAGDEKENW